MSGVSGGCEEQVALLLKDWDDLSLKVMIKEVRDDDQQALFFSISVTASIMASYVSVTLKITLSVTIELVKLVSKIHKSNTPKVYTLTFYTICDSYTSKQRRMGPHSTSSSVQRMNLMVKNSLYSTN